MKSGPFIDLVADTLGVERGTTRLVARALRESGWLTTGPRGVNAPDMKASDASRLIISLLTGAAPSRALLQFETFRALTLLGQEQRPDLEQLLLTKQVDTLDDCITRVIELLIDAHNPARMDYFGSSVENFDLTVNETRRRATTHIAGKTFYFLDTNTDARSEDSGESVQGQSGRMKCAASLPPQETNGIQTTRTVTFTEIAIIAKGLAIGGTELAAEHADGEMAKRRRPRDG